MKSNWIALGIFCHLALTLITFVLVHSNNTLHPDLFSPLLGYDENYWLFRSECYENYSGLKAYFYMCFLYEPNAWPIFMYGLTTIFGKHLIVLVLVKCLIFLVAAIIVIKKMIRAEKPWVRTYFYFLCLNPYIIFLHNTLMRDDIIVSLTLLVAGFLWGLNVKKDIRFLSRASAFIYLVILSLFMFRLGFGLITFVFIVFRVMSGNMVLSKSPSLKIFIVGFYSVMVTIIIYVVLNYSWIHGYQYNLSITYLLKSIYQMLYSPIPTSIINGTVLKLDTGVADIWVYALIYPIFSIFCTMFIAFVISYRVEPYFTFFKRNTLVVLYAFCLMLPYVLSVGDVKGPRQSLSATILLFYTFGLPFIISFINISIKHVGFSRSNALK